MVNRSERLFDWLARHQLVLLVLLVGGFALYYLVAGLLAGGSEPTDVVIDSD